MARRSPRPAVSPLMDALRPGVQLLPAFVHLPAKGRGKLGLRAALVLSQAYYMSKRTGGAWEYTPDDWKGTTGLSEDQASRALRLLVDSGYLTRRQRSQVRVMTYELDLQTLEAALLSCASITAELRACRTAESRACRTAESRLSLYERGSFLKKRGGEGATRRKRADVARPPAPVSATPERTESAWMEYAAQLSPAWVESKDAAKCWDMQESKGWDRFQNWQARARVFLAIWRDEKGGAAKEAKQAAAAASKQAAAAAAKVAVEDARKRRAELEALAKREDWPAVKAGEAAWRGANPMTFAEYLNKRPREWSQKIAALAPGRPWEPGTPPRR